MPLLCARMVFWSSSVLSKTMPCGFTQPWVSGPLGLGRDRAPSGFVNGVRAVPRYTSASEIKSEILSAPLSGDVKRWFYSVATGTMGLSPLHHFRISPLWNTPFTSDSKSSETRPIRVSKHHEGPSTPLGIREALRRGEHAEGSRRLRAELDFPK